MVLQSNKTVTCYIGIGSNLNEPIKQVKQAINGLKEIPNSQLIAHSKWYASDALGPMPQPDFINGVAQLQTQLTPFELLGYLQVIENAANRQRVEHWGPRTLDLDLLLFADLTMTHEHLKIPHPHILERDFVVFPLMELMGEQAVVGNCTLCETAKKLGITPSGSTQSCKVIE